MSKSRTMTAGNAGSSRFIALNGNIGGGNSKQGIPSSIDRVSGINYNRSYGDKRNVVFHMNQLGGVGRGRSMFSSNADGVSRLSSINLEFPQETILARAFLSNAIENLDSFKNVVNTIPHEDTGKITRD